MPAKPPVPLAFRADQRADAALTALRARLEAASIASPALDARCLVEAACGVERAALIAHGERPLGAAAAKLEEFAVRRLAGEPLARILGHQEFFGLDFSLSDATLVPRPETETLVEAVLKHCAAKGGRDKDWREQAWREQAWRILDLGAGSGCIGIALLSELPQATLIGIDRSPQALATARHNAMVNGVGGRAHWIAGDWGEAIADRFDIVVSNPPYIASRDIVGLATEVREHDPLLALDGGTDGLDCYRAIARELPRLLLPGGSAFFEIGAGQGASLREILGAEGLADMSSHTDLASIERVVAAILPRDMPPSTGRRCPKSDA
jgi:release factor glutamine methyltransferase